MQRMAGEVYTPFYTFCPRLATENPPNPAPKMPEKFTKRQLSFPALSVTLALRCFSTLHHRVGFPCFGQRRV